MIDYCPGSSLSSWKPGTLSFNPQFPGLIPGAGPALAVSVYIQKQIWAFLA